MKTKHQLSVILIFISITIYAQNLVPNGDFETYTSLPTSFAQCNRATGWNNVNGVYSGLNGTPDYFHTLGYMGTGSIIPIAPNSGAGQMAMSTGFPAWSSYREYISIQLNSTLIVGQEYHLTFYLTNGSSLRGSDNFGVHFSIFPLFQNINGVIPVTPQLIVPGIITNTNFWQQYTFTFIANTPADYVTFGNFASGNNTNFSSNGGYYYIDDIELLIYNPIQIQGDSSICLGISSTLTAVNDMVIVWAESLNPSNILSTDSILPVSPSITTTYFAYSTTDTTSFTINVLNPPLLNLGNDTTLCQGETLLLDVTTSNTNYLWQDTSNNPTFTVTQQGTYWVEITENNCSASDSILATYNPLPTINIGSDTSLCQGENIVIDVTTPNVTYLRPLQN